MIKCSTKPVEDGGNAIFISNGYLLSVSLFMISGNTGDGETERYGSPNVLERNEKDSV